MHRLTLLALTFSVLSGCGSSQEAALPPAPVAYPAPASTSQEPMAQAVPPAGEAKARERAVAESEASPPAKTRSSTYIVAKGDRLYSIARRYGVKVHDLIGWNNIRDVKRLKPGQVLKVSDK